MKLFSTWNEIPKAIRQSGRVSDLIRWGEVFPLVSETPTHR
jgi:hypothetical protein